MKHSTHLSLFYIAVLFQSALTAQVGAQGLPGIQPEDLSGKDPRGASVAEVVEGGVGVVSKVKKVSPNDVVAVAREQVAADNPKLQRMRERAQHVARNSAEHWRGVQEGVITPWAGLRSEWPAREAKVLRLRSDHAAIVSEDDPDRRAALSATFLDALQPIGPYLQVASGRVVSQPLTREQVAEARRLESANVGPSLPDPDGDTIRSLTPTGVYTLVDFPVAIKLHGPPDCEVYLSAGGGGVFGNGLNRQLIEADREGLVETTWVSRGDSIGWSVIAVSSPACVNEVVYHIEVVDLSLLPLPDLSAGLGK